jgi:hypothetical protein
VPVPHSRSSSYDSLAGIKLPDYSLKPASALDTMGTKDKMASTFALSAPDLPGSTARCNQQSKVKFFGAVQSLSMASAQARAPSWLAITIFFGHCGAAEHRAVPLIWSCTLPFR